VLGNPIVNGDSATGWCLGQREFLGCLPDQGCADVITYACRGKDQWQLPDACIPGDLKMCDPPKGQMSPNCPGGGNGG